MPRYPPGDGVREPRVTHTSVQPGSDGLHKPPVLQAEPAAGHADPATGHAGRAPEGADRTTRWVSVRSPSRRRRSRIACRTGSGATPRAPAAPGARTATTSARGGTGGSRAGSERRRARPPCGHRLAAEGPAIATVLAAAAAMLVVLAAASPAGAWGDVGHKVICEIAFQELTARARTEVVRLIRKDAEFRVFSGSCAWADHP